MNVQFDGSSNRNAVVHSATSCLLKSLAIVTGEAVVVDIGSPSRVIASGVGVSKGGRRVILFRRSPSEVSPRFNLRD